MKFLKYTRGGKKPAFNDSCSFKRKSIFQVPVVLIERELFKTSLNT